MKKKLIVLLLAVAMIFSLAACSTSGQDKATTAESTAAATATSAPEATATPAETTAPAAETVTDAAGREVAIPEKLDKVAVTCYGGATHELSILGLSDKIVAQPSMSKFPLLCTMYPAFNSVTDPGSFDDVNIEEIIKADPDMVFVGVSSKDGNKKIEDAGFPTYTMLIGWAKVDTLEQEFLNIGKITGNEAEAEKLVAYWEEKITMIKDAVAKVPENERKVVYYTGSDITSANSSGWTWPLIETVGATSALPEDHTGDVTVEEVMNWDPDVIIVQGKTDISGITGDARLKTLKAIKNNELYQCPIGAFWWDRPSPEAPLGMMWLAKTLYPEYTKDIDLEAETKAFYSEFYGYNLSDDEYNSFFFQ